MSLRIEMRFHGNTKVQRQLNNLSEKHVDGLLRVLNKSVLVIEARAKKHVPVLTGRLRSSITTEVKKRGQGYRGNVGTNVKYAPFVEFGTSKMPARPYLYPALKESKGDIQSFILSELGKIKP